MVGEGLAPCKDSFEILNLPLTFEKSPLLMNAVSKVSFSSSIPF